MTQPPNLDLRQENNASMFSRQFVLWLLLLSVVMFFAALTSAYLVKASEEHFLLFPLPAVFGYTTALVTLSSISMQGAYHAAQHNRLHLLRFLLFATLLLGIAFLYGQYMGWQALVAADIFLVGNPGGSFVYVISGVHALHLIGGLAYVSYVLLQTYRYRIHSENMLVIKMCATYWHFIGLLWIYLYVFFMLNA